MRVHFGKVVKVTGVITAMYFCLLVKDITTNTAQWHSAASTADL